MITTLTMNPTLDMTLTVRDFVPDDSNRVLAVQKDPGGKGVNVSRILTKLGLRVTTITLLGGHTGEEVSDLLRKERIHPFIIPLQNETRTNITITKQDNFAQTRFNQEGPFIDADEYDNLLSLVEQLSVNADVFVISGSLLPGVPVTAYREIINHLKIINPKLKIILDSDGDAYQYGIQAGPYMVKPNIHEAERLLGRSLNSQEELVQAMKDIHALGVELVVMSRGKEGLIAYDGKQMLAVDSLPVHVRSTVGAGDSLIAGICYMLERTDSLKEILSFATKVSAAKVMQTGTAVFGWDEIKAISLEPVVREL